MVLRKCRTKVAIDLYALSLENPRMFNSLKEKKKVLGWVRRGFSKSKRKDSLIETIPNHLLQ